MKPPSQRPSNKRALLIAKVRNYNTFKLQNVKKHKRLMMDKALLEFCQTKNWTEINKATEQKHDKLRKVTELPVFVNK